VLSASAHLDLDLTVPYAKPVETREAPPVSSATGNDMALRGVLCLAGRWGDAMTNLTEWAFDAAGDAEWALLVLEGLAD
jgi:hypothetical protein